MANILLVFEKEIFMQTTDFLNSKTIHNLARSYASECMEGARYQFLAKECQEKELVFLKMSLKQLAKHEMAHAKVFWDYIVKYAGSPVKNINIEAGFPFTSGAFVDTFNFHSLEENELFEHIYPNFAKIAEEEGFLDIAHSFRLIASVEHCHSMLLTEIYNKLKSNKLYKSPTPTKWKCSSCGFEHTDKQIWDTCPLCKLPKGYGEIKYAE